MPPRCEGSISSNQFGGLSSTRRRSRPGPGHEARFSTCYRALPLSTSVRKRGADFGEIRVIPLEVFERDPAPRAIDRDRGALDRPLLPGYSARYSARCRSPTPAGMCYQLAVAADPHPHIGAVEYGVFRGEGGKRW